MRVTLPHPLASSGEVALIGNPLKFSETPVSYRKAPPLLGEHTEEVLKEILALEEDRLDALRNAGVIAPLRA
jgi:crotonobetainyl-CoA:carnitine CoA-transferase CaiB-like acyl-CoA transferase